MTHMWLREAHGIASGIYFSFSTLFNMDPIIADTLASIVEKVPLHTLILITLPHSSQVEHVLTECPLTSGFLPAP